MLCSTDSDLIMCLETLHSPLWSCGVFLKSNQHFTRQYALISPTLYSKLMMHQALMREKDWRKVATFVLPSFPACIVWTDYVLCGSMFVSKLPEVP